MSVDLSVVVSTCRPKWLANCLVQLDRQDRGGLSVEVVVVVEGSPWDFRFVRHRWPGHVWVFKERQGLCGAFAKDVGVRRAAGEYVCFWDDDNVYYEGALLGLWGASRGVDVGVARAVVMGLNWRLVPAGELALGNVDTMCLCVRREWARRVRWSDHRGSGTDWYWLAKLLGLGVSVGRAECVVGEHLDGVE